MSFVLVALGHRRRDTPPRLVIRFLLAPARLYPASARGRGQGAFSLTPARTGACLTGSGIDPEPHGLTTKPQGCLYRQFDAERVWVSRRLDAALRDSATGPDDRWLRDATVDT